MRAFAKSKSKVNTMSETETNTAAVETPISRELLMARIKNLEDALINHELVLHKATQREMYMMGEVQHLRKELDKVGHRLSIGPYSFRWFFSTNYK
jgi:hypothetical protein